MRPLCKWIVPGALVLICGAMMAGPLFAVGGDQDATVYTWVDANGVRHFADQPGGVGAKAIAVAAPSLMSAPSGSTAAAPAASAKKAAAPPPTRPPASATMLSARCAQLRMQVEAIAPARRAAVKLNGQTHNLSGEDLERFKTELRAKMQSVCRAATPPS